MLLTVNGEGDGVAVAGWVLSGRSTRSTSRGIYIYVNNRFVKDRVIRHAVIAGYSGRLMKGRFPVAISNSTTPREYTSASVLMGSPRTCSGLA